jgi:hypothetical protein
LNLGYVVLASEIVARLVVIPYLMMAGGVAIANALNPAVVVEQSFVLWMAVNSLVGFPWAIKATIDMIVQALLRQAQDDALKLYQQELVKQAFEGSHAQNHDTEIH